MCDLMKSRTRWDGSMSGKSGFWDSSAKVGTSSSSIAFAFASATAASCSRRKHAIRASSSRFFRAKANSSSLFFFSSCSNRRADWASISAIFLSISAFFWAATASALACARIAVDDTEETRLTRDDPERADCTSCKMSFFRSIPSLIAPSTSSRRVFIMSSTVLRSL